MFRRLLCLCILLCFTLSTVLPNTVYAQALDLPAPGTLVGTSEAYVPVIMKGLSVKPENPLLFDFIVDTGNTGLQPGSADDAAIKAEFGKLVKYFLASLTLPEKDQWVNLSPYEKDRMMPSGLEKTELGRDMLAQDYLLKQVTASLIHPDQDLGKQFWAKVYAQAQAKFGTAEIPVDTFNKVWVTADKADVYVHNNTAFVVGSHLKIMLESDYLAAEKSHITGHGAEEAQVSSNAQDIAKQVVREIVLPALETEVNTGKNFANLRQIFHSMILATWYKKNLKEALLNQVYSNKAKTNGVERNQTEIDPQAIYGRYVEAYKKGVFNLIKEDADPVTGDVSPRKYFSGGLAPDMGVDLAMQVVPALQQQVSPAGLFAKIGMEVTKYDARRTTFAIGQQVLTSEAIADQRKSELLPIRLPILSADEKARIATVFMVQNADGFFARVEYPQKGNPQLNGSLSSMFSVFLGTSEEIARQVEVILRKPRMFVHLQQIPEFQREQYILGIVSAAADAAMKAPKNGQAIKVQVRMSKVGQFASDGKQLTAADGGVLTQEDIEKVGLPWDAVYADLTSLGWIPASKTELHYIGNIDEEQKRLSKAFEMDFNNILPTPGKVDFELLPASMNNGKHAVLRLAGNEVAQLDVSAGEYYGVGGPFVIVMTRKNAYGQFRKDRHSLKVFYLKDEDTVVDVADEDLQLASNTKEYDNLEGFSDAKPDLDGKTGELKLNDELSISLTLLAKNLISHRAAAADAAMNGNHVFVPVAVGQSVGEGDRLVLSQLAPVEIPLERSDLSIPRGAWYLRINSANGGYLLTVMGVMQGKTLGPIARLRIRGVEHDLRNIKLAVMQALPNIKKLAVLGLYSLQEGGMSYARDIANAVNYWLQEQSSAGTAVESWDGAMAAMKVVGNGDRVLFQVQVKGENKSFTFRTQDVRNVVDGLKDSLLGNVQVESLGETNISAKAAHHSVIHLLPASIRGQEIVRLLLVGKFLGQDPYVPDHQATVSIGQLSDSWWIVGNDGSAKEADLTRMAKALKPWLDNFEGNLKAAQDGGPAEFVMPVYVQPALRASATDAAMGEKDQTRKRGAKESAAVPQQLNLFSALKSDLLARIEQKKTEIVDTTTKLATARIEIQPGESQAKGKLWYEKLDDQRDEGHLRYLEMLQRLQERELADLQKDLEAIPPDAAMGTATIEPGVARAALRFLRRDRRLSRLQAVAAAKKADVMKGLRALALRGDVLAELKSVAEGDVGVAARSVWEAGQQIGLLRPDGTLKDPDVAAIVSSSVKYTGRDYDARLVNLPDAAMFAELAPRIPIESLVGLFVNVSELEQQLNTFSIPDPNRVQVSFVVRRGPSDGSRQDVFSHKLGPDLKIAARGALGLHDGDSLDIPAFVQYDPQQARIIVRVNGNALTNGKSGVLSYKDVMFNDADSNQLFQAAARISRDMYQLGIEGQSRRISELLDLDPNLKWKAAVWSVLVFMYMAQITNDRNVNRRISELAKLPGLGPWVLAEVHSIIAKIRSLDIHSDREEVARVFAETFSVAVDSLAKTGKKSKVVAFDGSLRVAMTRTDVPMYRDMLSGRDSDRAMAPDALVTKPAEPGDMKSSFSELAGLVARSKKLLSGDGLGSGATTQAYIRSTYLSPIKNQLSILGAKSPLALELSAQEGLALDAVSNALPRIKSELDAAMMSRRDWFDALIGGGPVVAVGALGYLMFLRPEQKYIETAIERAIELGPRYPHYAVTEKRSDQYTIYQAGDVTLDLLAKMLGKEDLWHYVVSVNPWLSGKRPQDYLPSSVVIPGVKLVELDVPSGVDDNKNKLLMKEKLFGSRNDSREVRFVKKEGISVDVDGVSISASETLVVQGFLTKDEYKLFRARQANTKDHAQNLVAAAEMNDAARNAPGGIDMNAGNMTLNEQGQQVDMRFDPVMIEQFKSGDFTGLTPVILNVTPIANIRPLLGLAPEAVGTPFAHAESVSDAVRRESEV